MADILPVFLSFTACGNRCIFCDQNVISGVKEPEDIIYSARKQIGEWFRISREWKEIAFYGGNFGAIDKDIRLRLFRMAKDLDINRIRYSTRPDTVTKELIAEIEKEKITIVELGIQSLDDNVLQANGRPYTGKEALLAAEKISGVCGCGVQLMTGMLGQSYLSSIDDAGVLAGMKTACARIYPTVVMKGTKLENFRASGDYHPTLLRDVIHAASGMYILFASENIPVIRCGLPIGEGFRENAVAGAYHESFGDIVKTYILSLYCLCGGKTSNGGYKGFIRKNFPDGFIPGSFAVKDDFHKICLELRSIYFEDNRRYFEGQAADIALRLESAAYDG